jgi:hypothetical protein
MDMEAQLSFQRYHQLCHSYFQAIMSGQAIQATGIENVIDKHFGSLKEEMDKNKALQVQVLQMQQTIEENQHQMLKMQQQALDRLAILQNNIRTLLTQTYELHEYPIPRLFIVLPKATRRRDKFLKPFANQFRLYFLCECGTHTMSDNSKNRHEIHLAKHEGYELDRPTEFFEKYGSYILTLMYMVKHGIMAAGVVVPPFVGTKLLEGLGAAETHLHHLGKEIGSLVDDAIAFLQATNDDSAGADGASGGSVQLDKLEVLEGADLRRLESYLKVKDEGRVLGNLYRIVTSEGHVKWVCIEHFRENYRESAQQRLRDIVDSNSGVFMEDLCEIEITLKSNTLAKPFYEALVDARGIQTLDITLEWDVTMADLKKFTAAVNKANIVDLTINGSSFVGPTLDTINRGRRYGPIVQLMSNGRLQALKLVSFVDFFNRTGTNSIAITSKLRVLDLKSAIVIDRKTVPSLVEGTFQHCQSLRALRLCLQGPESLAKHITGILGKLTKLQVLDIEYDGYITTALVHQGAVEMLRMIFPPDNKTYAEKRLSDSFLKEILRQNQAIAKIAVTCLPEDIQSIFCLIQAMRSGENIESTREEPTAPGEFWLEPEVEGSSSLGYEATSLRTLEYTEYQQDAPCITFEFSDANDNSAFTTSVDLTRSMYRQKEYDWLFLYYGYSITELDVRTEISDLGLTMYLNESVRVENKSSLRVLRLDVSMLLNTTLDHLSLLFQRSCGLEQMDVYCKDLHLYVAPKAAQRFLLQHGKKITGLYLEDEKYQWIPWLVQKFPARLDLPKLTELSLSLMLSTKALSEVLETCIQWIHAVVSPPPTPWVTTSTSSSVDDITTLQHHEDNSPETWSPLTRFSLSWPGLQPENWNRVLEAIDFSTLEELTLKGGGFSTEQFEQLVKSMADTKPAIRLQSLDLTSTALEKCQNINHLQTVYDMFREIVPRATIKGLDQFDLE